MKSRILLMVVACLFIETGIYSQSYVPQRNDKKMQVEPVVDIKAYSFNLKDVKLLESPFKEAMRAKAAYLLLLEPDRLLSDFRSHAGLTAKGEKYGGWESEGLAGHSLGHYLSACALQYASTGEKEFLKRVNYIVDELEQCQISRKTGYVGAIPDEDKMWAEVASGNIRSRGFDLNGAWAPWYTVHKIMAGLLDAYLYCDNEKALKVNMGIADWTGETIRNLSDAQMQEMMICEYGGMTETLVNTYALTKDEKYLDLSYRFYDKRILDSLAMGKDILPGKHSNTQIPKVIASARRYQLTGDEKDAAIADFFWNTVTENHSYAIGGNSNYEYFGEPGKLSDKLTDNTTETCNTYNMLKLTRHLFAIEPAAHYMDYYEKALYNHILASQNPANGMVTYYLSLRQGGHKEFSDEFNSFTCCVGTGMENHVKYGENIYFHGVDGGLYVNLFIPSELHWKEKGVKLKQENSWPADDVVNFTIAADQPVTFPLLIRKPHWAKKVQIKINGQEQKVSTDSSGFIVLNRKWKNKDKVEFFTSRDFYTEAMPDNENKKALFYGPLLMAGVFGETEPDPVKGVTVFVTSNYDPNSWIKEIDQSSNRYKTNQLGVPEDVEMVPFFEIVNDYYSVYWDVFSPEEWTVQQQLYGEEKQRLQDLEKRTVDIVRLGEMQPERDHGFTGAKTTTGDDHGKKWRSTDSDGYFSFKMKVYPGTKNTLMATYWGMDNRGRIFDILVDGEVIATEDLNKYKKSQFYGIPYEIPKAITKDKAEVTITFKAKEGNSAGPVYGCRMVRQD